jgi:hypothetical protein
MWDAVFAMHDAAITEVMWWSEDGEATCTAGSELEDVEGLRTLLRMGVAEPAQLASGAPAMNTAPSTKLPIGWRVIAGAKS